MPTRFWDWLRSAAFRREAFWFLVLVSWLPIVAGFAAFLDHFTPWAAPYGVGGPRLAQPIGWVFFAVAIGIGAGAVVLRDWWLLLCVPVALVASMLNEPLFGILSADNTYLLYLEAFVLSLVVYAVKSRLRSLHLTVFASLLALDLIGTVFLSGAFFTIGHLFMAYALSFFDLILFAAVLVFVRVAALAVVQNWKLLAGKPARELLWSFTRTTILWAPMLLIFLLFNSLYGFVGAQIERHVVYAMLTEIGQPLAEPPPTLEEAIGIYVNVKAAAYDTAVQAKLADGTAVAQAQAGATIDESARIIADVFPGRLPGTETQPCDWLPPDIFCLVMNGIKSIVNSAYVSVKNRLLSKLTTEAEKTKAEAIRVSGEGADWAGAFISTKIGEVRSAMILAIAKTFTAMRQIALLITIYSLIMLVKSYLLVFSRVWFRQGSANYAQVAMGTVKPSHGSIRNVGQVYKVLRGAKTNFYLSRRYKASNAPPATRIPRWRMAPISRLRNRSYLLNYIDVAQTQGTAEFHTGAPSEFVEWDLAKGEDVLFNFRDFVAMEEGLGMRTEISLSASTMIFGQVIFRRAVGPGKLILRTSSSAIVGRGGKANHSLSAAGLIAWSPSGSFQIAASIRWLDWWDTFFSDHHLQKAPGDPIVYDTSNAAAGRLRTSIGSLIKYFVLPF